MLNFYKPEGIFQGFLPVTKPYTKETVVNYLTQLAESSKLTDSEKNIVFSYLNNFHRPVNGLIFKDHEGNHITWFASKGVAIDRLAPDMFYHSYVKGEEVHFSLPNR